MLPGAKLDKGKAPWHLLPKGTVVQIVGVLEFGARKYAPNNWQKVQDARTRYYDALMRHIEAWWCGEQVDPETGIHHLAHAGCNILFLIWFDDHPEEVAAAKLGDTGLPRIPVETDESMPLGHVRIRKDSTP